MKKSTHAAHLREGVKMGESRRYRVRRAARTPRRWVRPRRSGTASRSLSTVATSEPGGPPSARCPGCRWPGRAPPSRGSTGSAARHGPTARPRRAPRATRRPRPGRPPAAAETVPTGHRPGSTPNRLPPAPARASVPSGTSAPSMGFVPSRVFVPPPPVSRRWRR